MSDLAEILGAIAEHSPTASQKVRARLQAVVDLLLEHPLIGQATDDPDIRRMVATPYPYLVSYEPRPHEVIVHAVRHAARDPASMPGGHQ